MLGYPTLYNLIKVLSYYCIAYLYHQFLAKEDFRECTETELKFVDKIYNGTDFRYTIIY